MRKFLIGWMVAALAAMPVSVTAQVVQTIDPNAAVASDAAPVPAGERGYDTQVPTGDPATPRSDSMPPSDVTTVPVEGEPTAPPPPPADPGVAPAATDATAPTYKRDDVIGAAEGVFGRGAEGLAGIIERILKDQGEPSAYIAGREASGAFIVGARYGSGTMTHKVEGQRPVYWTGPSVGFDFGGDATKVFTLVYNLFDSQELYRRYPQVEGRAYFVGGFSATYLRRGDIVLIPVRLGVGLRLGANIGYMSFSEKSRLLPF